MDLRPTSNAAAAFKDLQPSGLSNGGPLAALLLSHRALWLCSFVRLASDPPLFSAPLPIYEMGSRTFVDRIRWCRAELALGSAEYYWAISMAAVITSTKG